MRIGIISDTHGLLRREAVERLTGTDLIVHAGDIGDPAIIDALQAIAPVHAIRGNIDTEAWAASLPDSAMVQAGTVRIYAIHNIKEIAIDPTADGIHIVISGHSHQAGWGLRDGVLYINPGSAGPRRFKLPVTIAILDLDVTPWAPEFIRLLA